MNWLTSYVRTPLSNLMKRDTPQDMWDKCPSCEAMIYVSNLDESQYCCPSCNSHRIWPVLKRLAYLYDGGTFTRLDLPSVPADPLKFRDKKAYSARMRENLAKSELKEAIVVAEGEVGGHKVVTAAFNFSFMGGSMGMAVGEALVTAGARAAEIGATLLTVPASGGARMQEGILSLMQLPRSILAIDMVKEAGLPHIVLLTHPTTGGVTASFAMLGDIHVAEPGATIGFAGARVIKETVREDLPEGFQTAEYLFAHGMVDTVVPRQEFPGELSNLIGLLRVPIKAPLTALPEPSVDEVAQAAQKETAATRADTPTTPQTGRESDRQTATSQTMG